ncbi:hypothetical protein SCHPADRAFT_895285 [Schizopora paradoxa]|uniref:Uncharacterized protein n=1 Tax=Schizopora paradoxa TaxID=27342 RepID=A0A0H2R5J0_9AGAM|nr:hypothetical protein SCHPADRAFT_895285 [Schizopora paradoxa]
MTTDTLRFLWSALLKLWAFSPVLVPTMTVYFTIVPVSLKVWIGAQNAPRVLRNPKPKVNRNHVKAFFLCKDPTMESIAFALLLIIVHGVDYFVPEDMGAKKWIVFGILFIPGTYSVRRLPVRSFALIVARTNFGVPFFIQTESAKFSYIGPIQVFAGAGACIYALLNPPCSVYEGLGYSQGILYGSFLHVLLLGTVATTTKERSLKFCILTGGLIGTVSAMIIVGAIFHVFIGGPPRAAPTCTTSGPQSRAVLKSSSLSCVFSWFVFEIIALCYKMDYSHALEFGRIAAPVVEFRRLDNANSDTTGKETTSHRVLQILPSFRIAFESPYFNASITGLLVSAVFMAILLAWLDVSGRLRSGYEFFQFFLNIISMPFVCTFPLALAYKRGELRKVWGYKEKWADNPKGVSLVSSETEISESTIGLEVCEDKPIEERC